MAFTIIQNSFSAGELSPSVFGRTDLSKWHSGASTYRNFFVNYRGGAASRAGTAYVGMCKQGAPNAGGTPTNNPPRNITFQYSLNQGFVLEFGDQYMRIVSDGAYVVESTKNVSAITKNNPGVLTVTAHGYNNGDWVFAQNIGGMTEFNGLTWIVQNKTTNTFTLTDLFGNAVDTTAFSSYTSGGTFARIYTVITPYAAIDIPFLKFTQSANTMSLTCVNQITGTEYAPYDLVRNTASNWSLTPVSFASSINAPAGLTATAQSSTTTNTWYSYVVTAVASDGEESVSSTPVPIENNDISINAGSNALTWKPVSGATSYNVYAATPCYNAQVPVGVLYGLIGTSLSTNFIDTDIFPDFTNVPPVHSDPFARGQIAGVTPTAGGTGYTQATIGSSVTTSTGTGFVGTPVVSNGSFVALLIQNPGENYAATDTITITDSGSGTGATATLIVGAQSGTYPGVVAYFQQRRSYANTLNNPDTYYMSQPGAFLNMDSSIPTSDSDAIIGAPWAQQVNGIQFMVPMPGGLVVLTGSGAWQLNGGNNAAITPSDQTATPQAYNGCHNQIQPIVVNYDILYVQAKGSIVRDLSYNFFVNIYTGTDTTVLSNQLFNNHQLVQWAYAEEPYKIIWAVRDDGVLLSFTYLKEQDVYAWARHDTNGLFQSVCTVSEPPSGNSVVYIDAIYPIVKRYILGKWVYYSERMDNRQWQEVEDSWCVDAGLAYPMAFPNATLTPAADDGTDNISLFNLIYGGVGYTAPTIEAIDPTGLGSGFQGTLGISGGVITNLVISDEGQNYQGGTYFVINDSTGSRAKIAPIITNNISFISSSSVFNSGMVGDIIRAGGGVATITSFVSGTQVIADITQPITSTIPNDPNETPIPIISGQWSLSTPTDSVSGLNHLEGKEVAILADGSVVANQVVQNGSIELPAEYSQITIGLPFTAQLQTLYLDPQTQPGGTAQGKRKNLFGVTVRMEASRGMSVGANQPDASTQPNNATVPWINMKPFKERNALVGCGNAIPLFTGDEYIIPTSEWDTKSQIAVEQTYPLPANVLAVVAWYQVGDTAG